MGQPTEDGVGFPARAPSQMTDCPDPGGLDKPASTGRRGLVASPAQTKSPAGESGARLSHLVAINWTCREAPAVRREGEEDWGR